VLYLRIKRFKDFALIYLLNKALTKDPSLSKSLLFIKYIALQLSSKVLAKSRYLEKLSIV